MLLAQLMLGGGLSWPQAVSIIMPATVLLTLFLCHSSWHLAKAIPLRGANVTRLILSHLALAIVISGAWLLSFSLTVPLAEMIPGVGDIAGRIEAQVPLLGGVGLLYYLMVTAYHYLVLALEESRQAEKRATEARFLAQGSELKALKAQINPHFLFNSLHSISALTASEPAKARTMCIQLSDFLRSTLGLGERSSIPLEEELEMVRKYLAIEEIRFGDRIRYEERVANGAGDYHLPALLLQPIIENAVKHGVASMLGETRIGLGAKVEAGRLKLVIENQFDPDGAPRTKSGVGLRNVQERLLAAYSRGAEIRARADGDLYRVVIELPATRRHVS
jgi:sensor histidine kinase YesM